VLAAEFGLARATLAALMIEAGWTAGERFTVAHRDSPQSAPGAYLNVRDGRPPLIPVPDEDDLASAEPTHGPVATEIRCPGGELLTPPAGAAVAEVRGEERPVTLLRQWLDRAQSG
jgi:hypothetical protein